MVLRAAKGSGLAWRGLLAGAVVGFFMSILTTGAAQAQLLPAGFFDAPVQTSQGPAAVEADRMSYNSEKGLIVAEGAAVISYQGYVIRADRLEYDQTTGDLNAIGHVVMHDRLNNAYEMDSVKVTGGMKEAFIDSLTLTTAAGAKITARDAHYTDALVTTLTEASYSPCGLCVDSKGRKIGWKVKSARMTYDRAHAAVYLDQPSLEVLGVPVAWLPWFWIPDPTQPRAGGLRMPSVSTDGQRGFGLTVPYFIPSGENVDIILSPSLFSSQGFLMRGDVDWRIPELGGEIDVQASGIRQFNPGAYSGEVGDREWRGAIQTTGRFTPTKEWTVGWSYSAFTDSGYLRDYGLADTTSKTDEVYATYLTDDSYVDARAQHFSVLTEKTVASDPNLAPDKQAAALPVIEFSHVQDLAPGAGRVNLSGKLVSVYRGDDQSTTIGAVPYVYGYEGSKQHLELEGAWENQWILPGGITASPYLGARLDAAHFDRTTNPVLGAPYPDAPADASLLSATPIAAMDFRWPLLAKNGGDTHLLEPIAQIVYRGSSTTDVGITNEDAQSFVFDTSNLFSYNRFSGIDRQETGLRANLGAHYLGSFADGSWLELVAGQSFHLLGTNGLGIGDAAQTGTSTGLGSTASYIVASANGQLANGLGGQTAIQVDPATPRVTRAGAAVTYSLSRFWAGVSYSYIAANADLGTSVSHEIATNVSVPVADYWSLQAGYTHNIATNSWAQVTGGVGYDDGYFTISGTGYVKPTTYGFGFHLGLKGPDGSLAF